VLGLAAPTVAEKVPAAHGASWPVTLPCAQLKPAAQACGRDVPGAAQNAPAGQGRQTLAPVAFWKLPAAQKAALALPAGQAAPAGHTFCAAEVEPAGHHEPAAQTASGAASPGCVHARPAVHSRQAAALTARAPPE